MEDMDVCCVMCSNKNVYAVEQKNDYDRTIGIVFVCEECMDKVTGKTIQIVIGDPLVEKVRFS